jgi:hypothetical protein
MVVVQQTAPRWFDTVVPSEREHDGLRLVVRSVRREEPRLDVVVEYHVGGQAWTHAFDCYRIGEDELAADLAAAGLRFDRWLTDDHAWFTASPAPSTISPY